jgi:hypothetical protein
MQRYAIFFIVVNALHVSGGFSAHHHELKNFTHSTANSPTLVVAARKHDIYQMLCVQFLSLLMMGGKTTRNMYSIDSNKDYCITLHLVGYT